MLWFKRYLRGGDVVIALADEELMGKQFEEGDFLLKIGAFYRGELIDEEEARERVKEGTIINAVGERAVGVLIDLGLATEKSVKRVSGVPHVQSIMYFV